MLQIKSVGDEDIKQFKIYPYDRSKVMEIKKEIWEHLKSSDGDMSTPDQYPEFEIMIHTLKSTMSIKDMLKAFPGITMTDKKFGKDYEASQVKLSYDSFDGLFKISLEPWVIFQSYIEPATEIDSELDPKGYSDAVLTLWEQIIKL